MNERKRLEQLVNALDRHIDRLWRMGSRQDYRSIESADKAYALAVEAIAEMRRLLIMDDKK